MVDPRKKAAGYSDDRHNKSSRASLFNDMNSPVGADLLRDRELMKKLENV